MAQKLWLTQLTHFGDYNLTVLTLTKEKGISAIEKDFEFAQQERQDSVQSLYNFKDLLEEGQVRQYHMNTDKVEWI
jgi:hypothetical protein